MEFKKITVGNFAENLDRFRIPLSSAEREKKRGKYPYYGAAKIIDYVDGFTHSGLSVLIAEDGSVETDKGYPVVQLANGEYWVNNHTHVLKGKNDWDTLYLYYALQIIKVSPFVTGAVQKKISQKALNSMELNYFEDPMIRRKIVESLLELDKKIELNTQINQTLEQIAQTIFKSWFIDFDPVHAKANALASGQTAEQATQAAMAVISGKNTQELHRLQTANLEQYQQLWEIAEAFPSGFDEEGVPWGWEERELSYLFEFLSGAQPPKSEHIYEEKEGYERFIQNRDYSNDNHKTYIPISKKNKRCTEKDILMDKYGEAGKVRYGIKGAYNVALAKIVPQKDNLREFLRSYFTQDKIRNYLSSSSMASTRNSLNSTTFTRMKVIVPNDFLLSTFDKLANEKIDKILQIKQENIELSKLRDYLLPKLLSGEV
ncbi:restriction endonuclease subunit S [Glaesserella parasuis]|nr:restriction endonuclease subunit S [Glaesserella parasuis]MDO9999600.1 restriction endonuclease subunit S [Glaesserella parasuis]MDP0037646.1 restriction endonuclease subunit S [Glaesserella parasuis]MDP0075311.1 restriction endonuclease subunit S [Glaesserella parasuis]MDP0089957.1 restriction endonuclease subunit S [Glaesserella parasuis]